MELLRKLLKKRLRLDAEMFLIAKMNALKYKFWLKLSFGSRFR